MHWSGTDIEAGSDVDFTLDMSDKAAVEDMTERWDTLLVTKLLEHVYGSIRVLENALDLLASGGSLVFVGPAVWELHDFPADYWRPMPDFFIEFGRRNELDVDEMHWIVGTRLIPIVDLCDGSLKLVPSKVQDRILYGPAKAIWSRAVHRIAGMTGRNTFFPYFGLGVRFAPAGTSVGAPPMKRTLPVTVDQVPAYVMPESVAPNCWPVRTQLTIASDAC